MGESDVSGLWCAADLRSLRPSRWLGVLGRVAYCTPQRALISIKANGHSRQNTGQGLVLHRLSATHPLQPPHCPPPTAR